MSKRKAYPRRRIKMLPHPVGVKGVVTFSEKVLNLRNDRKLTQVQLAEAAGIAECLIGKIERRESDFVNIDTVCKIAKALGVKYKTLISFELSSGLSTDEIAMLDKVINSVFNNRVRNRRREKGWTQAQLAELSHVNRATVRSVESDNNMKSCKMGVIATALGVTKAWLKGEEDEPSNSDISTAIEA